VRHDLALKEAALAGPPHAVVEYERWCEIELLLGHHFTVCINGNTARQAHNVLRAVELEGWASSRLHVRQCPHCGVHGMVAHEFAWTCPSTVCTERNGARVQVDHDVPRPHGISAAEFNHHAFVQQPRSRNVMQYVRAGEGWRTTLARSHAVRARYEAFRKTVTPDMLRAIKAEWETELKRKADASARADALSQSKRHCSGPD